MLDLDKERRELARWQILQTLHVAGRAGASETLIFNVLHGASLHLTHDEVRRQLDYLEERELVTVVGRDSAPIWVAHLTRDGTDVVEHTVACDPGIARPKKYW